jgi:hypothetical protein
LILLSWAQSVILRRPLLKLITFEVVIPGASEVVSIDAFPVTEEVGVRSD